MLSLAAWVQIDSPTVCHHKHISQSSFFLCAGDTHPDARASTRGCVVWSYPRHDGRPSQPVHRVIATSSRRLPALCPEHKMKAIHAPGPLFLICGLLAHHLRYRHCTVFATTKNRTYVFDYNGLQPGLAARNLDFLIFRQLSYHSQCSQFQASDCHPVQIGL
jgi:hypothetical protein